MRPSAIDRASILKFVLGERSTMQFAKELRERVRSGRIRCSIRIWMRPHVKVGGKYPLGDGHVVVDSIEEMSVSDITYDLARESGFQSVEELLRIAKHGRGSNVYLVRFHYLPPGAWERRPAHDAGLVAGPDAAAARSPRSRKRLH